MDTIIRGYKYQIYPTEEQSKQIDNYIDLFRYVYNWGVEKEEEVYKQYLANNKQGIRFYSDFDLYKLFRVERNNSEKYWLKNIPDHTARNALKNVYDAYQSWFNGINGKPKFASKKKRRKSFNTRNDTFTIKNDRIRFEGMKRGEFISLNFKSGFDIKKVINPVVSKDNLGRYFVSFNLEKETSDLDKPKSEGIGIDVGLRQTYALSSGEIFNQPNEKLEKLERRRKRQQRHIQRDIERRKQKAIQTRTKYEDIPKSKRELKRELEYNKTCNKISNIKNTCYDQITSNIISRNPEFVCMETINVKNLQKDNPYLNKDRNVSFYSMTQKMKNKCEEYNIPFIQAPQSFASTKICSNCGNVKYMGSKHTYKCPVCGMIEDRDINAAINLKNYGLENNIHLIHGVYYDLD